MSSAQAELEVVVVSPLTIHLSFHPDNQLVQHYPQKPHKLDLCPLALAHHHPLLGLRQEHMMSSPLFPSYVPVSQYSRLIFNKQLTPNLPSPPAALIRPALALASSLPVLSRSSFDSCIETDIQAVQRSRASWPKRSVIRSSSFGSGLPSRSPIRAPPQILRASSFCVNASSSQASLSVPISDEEPCGMLCRSSPSQSCVPFDSLHHNNCNSFSAFQANYTMTTSSSPSDTNVTIVDSQTKPSTVESGLRTGRPRNHHRSSLMQHRFLNPTRPSILDKNTFLSTQEQNDQRAAATNQLLNVVPAAANRRPKVMRMTPAFPTTSSLGRKSSSTPLNVASSPQSSSSSQERSLLTPSESKVPFPISQGSNNDSKAPSSVPLHPASRKALALKAGNPGPEVQGLHLDLQCLPTPTARDQHSVASTSTLTDLVRKKSGEPVKPSLKYSSAFLPSRSISDASLSNSRAKSVPTTPNVPKAVHFDTNLEHVKIFKVKGRPTAVSREASPEQTETETEEEREANPWIHQRRLPYPVRNPGSKTPSPAVTPAPEAEEQLLLRLPNFPSSAKLSVDRDIFLERVYLSDDLRSVKGTVQVRNLCFEKWVAVRFTLDDWATVNEVSAEHSESIKDGTADRFVFSIKLNELLNWPRGFAVNETKTMFLCLRYTVPGREIWDNNAGGNYQLDFRKRQLVPPTNASLPPACEGAQPASRPFGATVPRRYTTSAMTLPANGVVDMERTSSSPASSKFDGDPIVQRLRRELDRLRTDEEQREELPPSSGPFKQDTAKRRSPPASPIDSGDGRSSSPSIWSARYDFGASLRDPVSGSRTTNAGRAAALDYFSSRPIAQASFPISSAPLTGPTSRHPLEHSPNVGHRLGMLSPGLGDGIHKHQPVFTLHGEPRSIDTLVAPRSAPCTTDVFSFATKQPLNDQPAARSVSSGDAVAMMKPEPLLLDDYTPEGSQGSSTSPIGSPNPFSPALSASSLDSDTTEVLAVNDEPVKSLSGSLEDLEGVSFLRPGDFGFRPRPSSFTAGDNAEEHGYEYANSQAAPSSDDFLRPTSLNSFNELVARFCWNSDNQQHLQGTSDDVDGLASSPPTGSGRSTPTARAGAVGSDA